MAAHELKAGDRPVNVIKSSPELGFGIGAAALIFSRNINSLNRVSIKGITPWVSSRGFRVVNCPDVLIAKLLHQPPLVVIREHLLRANVVGVPLPRLDLPIPLLNEAGGVIFKWAFFGRRPMAAQYLSRQLLGPSPRGYLCLLLG